MLGAQTARAGVISRPWFESQFLTLDSLFVVSSTRMPTTGVAATRVPAPAEAVRRGVSAAEPAGVAAAKALRVSSSAAKPVEPAI